MKVTEDQLQIFAADLLRAKAREDVVWFHVPNQASLSIAYKKRLKRFGVRPGVSDFIIFTSGLVSTFVLCLELKTLKGVMSEAQRRFKTAVQDNGCCYVVARSPEEIKSVLTQYGILKGVQ